MHRLDKDTILNYFYNGENIQAMVLENTTATPRPEDKKSSIETMLTNNANLRVVTNSIYALISEFLNADETTLKGIIAWSLLEWEDKSNRNITEISQEKPTQRVKTMENIFAQIEENVRGSWISSEEDVILQLERAFLAYTSQENSPLVHTHKSYHK